MRRLFLLALLFCSWPVTESLADTEFRGEQSLWQDTVWSGRVLVDGILTIPAGVTLEIRPGTEVRFTRRDTNGDGIGENEIFIQGVLRVLGTAENPVRFTSAEADPVPGDWGALNMMASEEENLLEHCLVEYGYRGFHAHFANASVKNSVFSRNLRGLQFQESTVVIDGCLVEKNFNGMQFRNSMVRLSATRVLDNHWGIRCVYSELTMHDCEVAGNLVNGVNLRDSSLDADSLLVTGNRKGIYLQRSRGSLRGSRIRDNSEHGILLEDSDFLVVGNLIAGNGRAGVRWLNSRGELRDNHLAGNGEYALVNEGEGTVDARSNWWGTTAAELLAAAIRDGSDIAGRGLVDAGDPLAAPPSPPAAGLQ
ncbi:right-handed parallel beta-helix repeat-containing protein [Trichloromonas sp.]|uniref:right-handed parallel beta-helix repeat-containing protein n=1 Tax=Trichloromonas sp. TaxID=3069249 RepID=UPI003D8194A7